MNYSISEDLKKLICSASVIEIDEKSISENTNIINDLNLDSISIISLITAIEEYYRIVFDDDFLVLQSFDNFGDLISLIENKLNEVYDEEY